MNHHLDDPALQALEARLAAVTPQVSATDRNELLYQCAFAAGRKAANRTIRTWQATAAMLVVLVLGMSIPLAQNQWTIAKQEPSVPQPIPTPSPSPSTVVERDVEIVRSPVVNVSTDAWQIEKPVSEIAQTDVAMSPLAVASLTRSVLEQ